MAKHNKKHSRQDDAVRKARAARQHEQGVLRQDLAHDHPGVKITSKH
ncbi:hypothetical protein ACFQ3L_00730 [Lacticaseibacillus jixianensis]|uniref:DUF3941 domain-containing protein n=1 Tax=Lacticaseibacillus jixianensis TaxID=2486012 RepID=A0ABW4B781_9LACO|nr:hypothetical protein [Lacticaseibacillus jixianensis]